MKKFWLFAVPCAFWWFFVLYMIFGNFQFQGDGFGAGMWSKFIEFFGAAGGTRDYLILTIFVCIVFCMLIIALFIFLLSVCCVFFFFDIPIESFISGFFFDNWLIWFAIIALVLTIIGAAYFELGHFLEDPIVVTGHHYEAEYKSSTDKVEIKQVEDTKGGDGFIINFLLFIVRMIIIAAFGIILFFVYFIKDKRNKSRF